jgi:copper chaperone CopZ
MKSLVKILFTLVIAVIINSTLQAQINASQSSLQDDVTIINTKVKGITCSKDLKMISDSVLKLDGVKSCEASKAGPTTTFQIYFNPLLVSEKDIHVAIQNTGSCENPNERPYKVKSK